MAQVEITEPTSLRRFFGIRLGIPVGIVVAIGIIGGVASGKPALITWTLIAVAIMAVILGVELPLILRTQARNRRRLVAKAPSGTLFACRATPLGFAGYLPSGSLRQQSRNRGVLAVGSSGVSYRPLHAEDPNLAGHEDLGWTQISKVKVVPKTALGGGTFEVTNFAGFAHRWQVSGIPELVDALNQLGVNGGGG